MAENWYYKLMGMEFGPVSSRVIADMVQGNHLSPTDEVREGQSGSWITVHQAAQSLAASATALPAQAGIETDTDLTVIADAEPAKPASPVPDNSWYCHVLGQQLGPMTLEDLCTLVAHGELAPHDYVKQGLHGRWVVANRMPGLYFTRVALS